MAESDDNREVHQREWARRIGEGASDDVTPLEMTPEDMYRAAGWRAIGTPPHRPVEETHDAMVAYWGADYSLKDGRDLAAAQHAEAAMLAILRSSELAHIFTGTAKDFDTIHELRHVLQLAIDEAYTQGYIAHFDEATQAEA